MKFSHNDIILIIYKVGFRLTLQGHAPASVNPRARLPCRCIYWKPKHGCEASCSAAGLRTDIPQTFFSSSHCILSDILFLILVSSVNTVVFPKEGQGTRSANFLRFPSRSRNTLILWSAAQSIANLFDLEACPASLIWPSFGNTPLLKKE
jgi:hypothetical protein